MQSIPSAEPDQHPGTSAPAGEPQRLRDLLAMHMLARRPDSSTALLDWLGRRTGAWAGLLDTSGRLLAETSPGLHPDATSLLTGAIKEMLDRGLSTFSVDDGPGSRAVLLAVNVPAGGPGLILASFGPNRVPAVLLTDAAVVLPTCWSADETRRIRTQVEITESSFREAVLHLLTSRNLAIAHQLASTLSHGLPDPMRVYIIASADERRGEVISRCAELTDGKAWSVRCPVYSSHVIVLAPASSGSQRDAQPLEVVLATEIGDCVVGAGDVVALVDTAVGYEQAFHALAVAHGLPQRSARFSAALDLPTVLGRPGLTWATTFLAPLIEHVPARAGDPDAHELTVTARSWLSFSSGATSLLKIHRNTLRPRLRGLEELLGLDLSSIGAQAALSLALRMRAAPSPAAGAGAAADPDGDLDLDDLLRLPRTQQWAQATLRPIRESAHASVLEPTLRVWLDSDSRLSTTAEALDISRGTARKRIMRIEQVLGRSLLQVPSARYDLWMAVRASDLGA